MPNQKKYVNGDNLVTYDGIIKDWVDAKTVELTQAAYNALTPAEQMNGTEYYVTDGHSGGGTTDYDDLDDKPSINNVELSGNKTSSQLGLLADSDISSWAKASTKPTYTASEVGAVATSNVITTIDTSTDIPTSNAVKTYVDDAIQTNITSVLNTGF